MIVLDGASFDLVVQREGLDFLLADSDGTVYGRFSTEQRARAALTLMEARLIAQGGRRA